MSVGAHPTCPDESCSRLAHPEQIGLARRIVCRDLHEQEVVVGQTAPGEGVRQVAQVHCRRSLQRVGDEGDLVLDAAGQCSRDG